jgi:hypothetical protein
MHVLVTRSWRRAALACAAFLIAPGCVGPAAPALSTATAALPPGSARIWFYRNFEPTISLNLAEVSVNGTPAGYVQPDGSAIHRDVAPGRYQIAVASDGLDVNQSGSVELGPGQEAFVKVLASASWESGGDTSAYKRDTFYVSFVLPQVARAELGVGERPPSGG